jgi:PhnB protein
MPSESCNNILHGSLIKDGVLLMMGSDMIGENLRHGNAVALRLNCGSDQEINTFFNNLSADGEVKHPLHQSFWGATYGELTDKFGILWIFNYSRSPQSQAQPAPVL